MFATGGPFPFPVRLEFFVALGLLIAGIGLAFYVGRRRPPGTPLTWGEAIIAATYVFGLMLLGYGIVPNEWLKWADNQLLWRSDRILYKVTFFGRGKITISFQAIRDIIAAGIYVIVLGAQVALWAMFQKRGQAAATEAETSDFGRPLVRRV